MTMKQRKAQTVRWIITLAVLGAGCVVALPAVWAADGDEQHTTPVTAEKRAEVLKAIEETKATDPALAQGMLDQLKLAEEGQVSLLPTGKSTAGGEGTTGGTTTPTGEVSQGGTPGLVGPPVEGDQSTQDSRFQQVQSDARMQDIHKQFDAGELTKQEAFDRTADVLRSYGIEPDNGREWGQGGQDFSGRGQERGEGFSERAWEHMSPEAKEQMERFVGHEGTEHTGESSTREHEYAAPEREYSTVEREFASPERYTETPEHTYEAPESYREYQQYEAPPQP